MSRRRSDSRATRRRADAAPTVRLATEDDFDFICVLAGEVFAHLGPSYAEWSREWMADPRVGTFVAARGDTRLGYIMLATAVSASGLRMLGNVLAVAVVATARRQGIGRLLLQSALEILAHADTGAPDRRVDLTVAEDNPAARALFESFGFQLLEGGEATYPAGQRSLSMCRAVETEEPAARKSRRRVIKSK